MIPILYDKNETEFTSNGLGRLYDCISCIVTEERNGIYECDFEYPITGAHYEDIQVGRIIGVSHGDATSSRPIGFIGELTDEQSDVLTDENGLALSATMTRTETDYDVQPFDIVSYTKPIDGVVTFHCTHISYRQCYIVTLPAFGAGTINSLADAFHMLETWTVPVGNPFSYWTNKSSTGYLSCADGMPRSIRSVLGGIEGSILDAYGGEYEWDKWTVKLWASRGQVRDFQIRYGVNMLDYNEEYDIQGTYSSCMPYWTDGVQIALCPRVASDGLPITGREQCVPLDLSDKFETFPDVGQLQQAAKAYLDSHNPYIPQQNIHVEFARLQDLGYEEYEKLLECNLCDTITVIFPDYHSSAQYKIVKTVWDALRDKYESMELGDLSVSLAEALGVSSEQEAKKNILNSIYPIGSIYISTKAGSPADLFGGTWVQIKGRFLLSTGSPDDNTNTFWGTDLTSDGTNKFSAAPGTTGGESRHTLSEGEMPNHYHNSSADGYSIKYITASEGSAYGVWGGYDGPYITSAVGGGASHNNMPPYLAVYMWERTA